MQDNFSGDHLTRRAALGALGFLGLTACASSHMSGSQTMILHGADLSGSDPRIRPQDDLYRYVNGKWLAEVKIPPDQMGIAAITELEDKNTSRLHQILENITATQGEEYQLKALYNSALNTQELDAQGLIKLEPLWKLVDQANSRDDLAYILGDLSWNYGLELPLSFEIDKDWKNSSRYIFAASYGDLGLERKYFVGQKYQSILEDYKNFLTTIYSYANFTDPVILGQKIVNFEQSIANIMPTEVELIDPAYHIYSLALFQQITSGLNVTQFIAGAKLDIHKFNKILVSYPAYCAAFAQLWSEQSIDFLKVWIKANILIQKIDFLPQQFRDAKFSFYEEKLAGVAQPEPRWKYAVHITDQNLPDALGKLYVDKYFPSQAQERLSNLIKHIKLAYRKSFAQSWLEAKTKQAAIVKLDHLSEMIGYPRHWNDYSSIVIGADFYHNILNIFRWKQARKLADFDFPVKETGPRLTIPTPDAYNDREANRIYICAGICQAPFFDITAEPAVNYGALGAIIGHEISHAFDVRGSQLDAQGNLHDWWTVSDRKHFDKLTRQLIKQYNSVIPVGLSEDHHVNGAQTVTENSADLNGLSIALKALRAYYNHGDIDGSLSRSQLQTFFYSYARIWREKLSPQAIAHHQQIADPLHPVNEIRCNQVVKNIDDFYTAFDVKPGDKEYLAPDLRVHFW